LLCNCQLMCLWLLLWDHNVVVWSIDLVIMLDALLLRPSLHFCTSPSYTSLHYTCRHFTSSHWNFTQPHFTALSFRLTPFKFPAAPFHFTALHLTLLHFTALLDDFRHTSVPLISPRL
jgi:hypothetical protein